VKAAPPRSQRGLGRRAAMAYECLFGEGGDCLGVELRFGMCGEGGARGRGCDTSPQLQHIRRRHCDFVL
jgi:hypothetical protein